LTTFLFLCLKSRLHSQCHFDEQFYELKKLTMKNLSLILALICSTSIYSQSASFKITGTLQMEGDKSPIESATIHLEKVSDSTVVTYKISNDKGYFSLEGKSF